MRRALVLILASLLLVVSVEAQYSMGPGKKKRSGGGGVSNPVQPNETSAPTCNITSPSTGPLGGLNVTVNANAADTGGSGVAAVNFYWVYCPSLVCEGEQLFATDTTSTYSGVWTFPACGPYPDDHFEIHARSTDGVGNISTTANVVVRLTGRGC